LQEVIFRGAKFINRTILPQALQTIGERCPRLQNLSIQGQLLDETLVEDLRTLLSSARQLKKLDVSYMKLPKFSLLLNVLDTVSSECAHIQHLNIAGNGVSAGGLQNIQALIHMSKYIDIVA